MSSDSQFNNDNQEIDLSQISKKIGGFFENIATFIFNCILFLKRNILVIGILFVLGVVLGYFMDKNSKSYESKIIVTPNFGSNDYLYSKVNALNSKIRENDTIYLMNLGFKDAGKISQVDIEPIVDIYKFIDNNVQNFELIKLMAEDGDLNKIVEDKITSKNYPFHSLKITTSKKITDQGFVKPLLNYLNDSEYFKSLQKEFQKNSEIKLKENDTVIKQIDGFLNDFKKNTNDTKSSSLIYYNENTQLNEIIKTKESLIKEQGDYRIQKINIDKIIKDVSIVTNVKNSGGTIDKMKLILPILFIFLFIIFGIIKSFYKRQLAKSKL